MPALKNRGGPRPRNAGSQQKLQEARDSPLERLEVSAPCWHLNFSPMTLDTSLQNYERTSVCCSKPQGCDYLLQQLQETNTRESGFSAGYQLCPPQVPSLRLWTLPPTWVGNTHVCVYTHAHTHIYTKQGPPDDLPCYILKVGPWSKYRAGILWGPLFPPSLGWRILNVLYLLQWKGALGKRHPRATVIDAKDLTVAHSLRRQASAISPWVSFNPPAGT